MNALTCPMCSWSALMSGSLDRPEARWAARRVLDMHFDVHVAELAEELEDELC